MAAFFSLFSSTSSSAPSINSPMERTGLPHFDKKLANRCAHEGIIAGTKAAAFTTIATAIPTLTSVRLLPWAKANLNPTAQALIISLAAGSAYFIVADKTVLKNARKNSFEGVSSNISA